MTLNNEQKSAFQYALDGHSLLLLGSAGTGKSFVVQHIADSLKRAGKSVHITATTGIASSHYKNALTIHRWSGIGDGRHSSEELTHILRNNKQYASVTERIINSDVLIVDECSMMSKRFFEQLDRVCRIKDSNMPFGGIQVIFVGDFKQLPPVPNTLYGDDGSFCFKSNIFHEVFRHKVILTQVVRQNSATLINAISACALGPVSPDTQLFLSGLSRELTEDVGVTKLFPMNHQVDSYNREQILRHPGQLYEMTASDTGEQRYLSKMSIPKTLWLKIGAPVILLRNISDKLVNGMQGIVTDISEFGPVVKFKDVAEMPIEKMKCSVFSPSKNLDVASRIQYPLKLAFAISIHKSQGMTLDRVEVDCKGIFKAGQLSVALGRCRSVNGLRVINFSPHVCIPQPGEVLRFLDDCSTTNTPYLPDLSCCRNIRIDENVDNLTLPDCTMPEILLEESEELDEEEFDEDFDNAIREIDAIQSESENTVIPQDLNIEDILKQIYVKNPVTNKQEETNYILDNIDAAKYRKFVGKELAVLKRLTAEMQSNPGSKVSVKKQTEFYTQHHNHMISLEHRMSCLELFNDCIFTEAHLHITFNICNALRVHFLTKEVELLPSCTQNLPTRKQTNASLSRVRYVGGWSIAKTLNSYMKKKMNNMFKADKRSNVLYEEARTCVDILSDLKVSEHYINTTTAVPDTLLDIERRQTSKNRSLVNISDQLFNFFLKLTDRILSKLSDQNLHKYGQLMPVEVRDLVCEDEELITMFCDITKEDDAEKTHSKIILKKIIKKVFMLMLGQFRKDLIENYNIQKKMPHRKQIQVSGKGKKSDISRKKSKTEHETEAETESGQPSQKKRRGLKKKQKPEEENVDSDYQLDIEIESEKKTGKRDASRKVGQQTKMVCKDMDIEHEEDSDIDQEKITEEREGQGSKSTMKDLDVEKGETEINITKKKGKGSTRGKEKLKTKEAKKDSKSKRKIKAKDDAMDEAGPSGILEQISAEGEDEEACSVCFKEHKIVKGVEETDWVQCDGCLQWLHRSCAGLKNPLKWKKATKADANFFCKSCD